MQPFQATNGPFTPFRAMSKSNCYEFRLLHSLRGPCVQLYISHAVYSDLAALQVQFLNAILYFRRGHVHCCTVHMHCALT